MIKYFVIGSLMVLLASDAGAEGLAEQPAPAPVAAEAAVCPSLSLAPVALPNAIAGVPYSHRIRAYGGHQPVSLMVTSGAFPPGLTASLDGGITGTPKASGTFTFTVTATDSCRTGSQKASRIIRLNIAASPAGEQAFQPSVFFKPPLKVTVTPTPDAFNIPFGKGAERRVSYRITSHPADTAPLTSPGATFSVAGAVVESVAAPLSTTVINGSAVLTENIVVPLRVIETALREKSKIVYSRAFSGRETTALAIVEFTVSPAQSADR